MILWKVLWKYSRFSWNRPPQPVKHTSQANTSSSMDQWSKAISNIPLYLGKKSLHHPISALTLSMTGKRPLLCKPIINSRLLDTNRVPRRTQLARNWSLPTAEWIALRDISFASYHWSKGANASWSRWIGTDGVKFMVSNGILRNTICVLGLCAFEIDSSSPANSGISNC